MTCLRPWPGGSPVHRGRDLGAGLLPLLPGAFAKQHGGKKKTKTKT